MHKTLSIILACLLLWGCGPNVRDPIAVPPRSDYEVTAVPPGANLSSKIDRDLESGKSKGFHYKHIEYGHPWGPTVVYDSDIGKMFLTLEKNGEQKEFEATVSYAMCLDFINQNFGKRSKSGYRIITAKCTQKGLGKEY